MLLLSILLFIISQVESDVQNKIIGGVLAKDGEYPFLVSLQILGFHFCGGSIISDRHVLTAAHCFFTKNKTAINANLMTVNAGSIKINSETFSTTIKNLSVYEKYGKFHYDIAVVEVDDRFPLGTSKISKIPLIDFDILAGSNCTVAGWGVTDKKVKVASDVLKAVNVTVVDLEACRQNFSTKNITLYSDIVCASGYKKDACQGDSGGPLIFNNTLAGIVSNGLGCAEAGFPGLYTNVFHYLQWIKDALGGSTEDVISETTISEEITTAVFSTVREDNTTVEIMTTSTTDYPCEGSGSGKRYSMLVVSFLLPVLSKLILIKNY